MKGDPNDHLHDAAWYGRLRDLRLKLALAVTALALIAGALIWMKNTLLTIDPGKGIPLGYCIRTDDHVATLIQTQEPYTPSLHRDGSKDTYTVSLFVVPLDGSDPWSVRLSEGLPSGSFSLAKVLGGDGERIWFDVNGTGHVDLSDRSVRSDGAPPKQLQGGRTLPFAPRPERHLAAGYLISSTTWCGLLSEEEALRDHAPGKFLRRIVSASGARVPRRFHRGTLDPDTSSGYRRILAMEPMDTTVHVNAAFLRLDEQAEPLRMTAPDGALMVCSSDAHANATLVVARVDTQGQVLWKVDTGIDRFTLQQVLPGTHSSAFVGTRPPVPDKVPEPVLVLVEHATGRLTVRSLWQ